MIIFVKRRTTTHKTSFSLTVNNITLYLLFCNGEKEIFCYKKAPVFSLDKVKYDYSQTFFCLYILHYNDNSLYFLLHLQHFPFFAIILLSGYATTSKYHNYNN